MLLISNYTTETTTTVTTEPSPSPEPDVADDSKYLVVPLVVIVFVIILTLLVYLMAKRRKYIILKKNILSLYEFDANEQEWESLTNSYDQYHNYTNEATSSV
ncbi:unnamed protein product [Phyllotreta striolata]|uniref:Uncharacterized protein n=1 Tax=Phyllotreta striolata TaxID=444603 RepID=A0A9N9TMM1_PHYSR|nr:unnamed protein product [Phyllotreta striolata]